MRNLKKENEWRKSIYKNVNIVFRKDTESELLNKLEQQAKDNNITLTEHIKNIVVENA